MSGRFTRMRKRLRRRRGQGSHQGHHHGGSQAPLTDSDPGLRKLALVGNPNTGKSVMFINLTGSYATVSNYPGTTVEVTRSRGEFEGVPFEVVDTPGMYSLFSITEEERVARSILLNERPDVVLQLVDAKNLERMLLTRPRRRGSPSTWKGYLRNWGSPWWAPSRQAAGAWTS